MSRRTAKKRLKKINQVQTPVAETPVSAAVTETQEVTPASAAVDMQHKGTAAPEAAAVQAESSESTSVQTSTASAGAPAAPAVPEAKAPAYEMFLQYQNAEFMIDDIAQRILNKCAAEGMDSDELKIYVKPEDRKAYYACAGGSSYIDL